MGLRESQFAQNVSRLFLLLINHSFGLNKRAYNNLERGTVSVAKDLLFDANINRSPSSYLLNPQSERDRYADEGDTDKSMLLLKFTTSSNNEPIGMLNWFAVHGTSMNVTNLVRLMRLSSQDEDLDRIGLFLAMHAHFQPTIVFVVPY